MTSKIIGFFQSIAGKADSVLTTKGDLATYSTTRIREAVGTNNKTLMADSAQATGIKWGDSATSTLTTAGDLLVASGANTLSRLARGSDNYILKMNGTSLNWEAESGGKVSLLETVTLGSANANVAKASMSYSTDDYAYFIIAFSGKAVTSEAAALEFRINNLSANYGYTVTQNYNGTLSGSAAGITTEIPLMSATVHTGNSQPMNVIVTIQSSTVGNRYYNIVSDCWVASNTVDTEHVIGGQAGTASSTFSKFDFFLSTGNNFDTASEAVLYGVLR